MSSATAPLSQDRSMTFSRFVLVSAITAVLAGCGAAHVRTELDFVDIEQYANVYIGRVDLYSKEQSAQTNEDLQMKLEEWQRFARSEIEQYVRGSSFQLVNQLPSDPERTLIINTDINVAYGNRALRYFVGFGAGKGGVDSTLVIVDAKTGAEKFKAVAESDLAIGGFGGDMGAVLRKNIRKLTDQIPGSM